MDSLKFANIIFKGLRKKDLLSEESYLKFIIPANAEFIVRANENKRFLNILNNNFITFDGQIPYMLAKRQNPDKYFEKLSGSDLIYDFCEMAYERQKKIFLLGGYEESNRLAVEKLREKYNIEIRGYSPPYKPYPFDREHDAIIIHKIKEFSPDILFVGFGAVKQELWINEHKQLLDQIGVRWVIGSGGTFEFVACTLKRAPKWIQKIGMEGVYRFVLEPKWFRFKRLFISLKIFMYIGSSEKL